MNFLHLENCPYMLPLGLPPIGRLSIGCSFRNTCRNWQAKENLMRRNCWMSTRVLAAWALPVLLAGCSPEPRVTGQVWYEFGKAVSGATVEIQGTTFRSTTDTSGKYSVPYVPG